MEDRLATSEHQVRSSVRRVDCGHVRRRLQTVLGRSVSAHEQLASDAFLGLCVVALGLVILAVALLAKDPLGRVREVILRRRWVGLTAHTPCWGRGCLRPPASHVFGEGPLSILDLHWFSACMFSPPGPRTDLITSCF